MTGPCVHQSDHNSTMRCQCSICSELFETASVIAAIPCGHVFHDVCIMQWLNGYGHTCPQCREKVNARRIIHKLYFDEAEGGGEEVDDYAKLKNELESAKLQLQQKEKHKNNIIEEKGKLAKELELVTESRVKIEQMYKDEQVTNSGLRKQLTYYRQQMKEADMARESARQIRKQLETMESVKVIVNSVEADVKDLIGSSGDPKQLATWCAVLKKELNAKRTETRTLKEEAERFKKELHLLRKESREKESELKKARENNKMVEEDMHSLEAQNLSLKRKMDALSSTVVSPRTMAESFTQRLIHESPAPVPPTKRPRLSMPPTGELDLTTDASPTSESPSLHRKKNCKEYGMQFVKISSASKNATVKQQSREAHDISNLPGLCQMNLFKKSGFASGHSNVIRKGYNGLGSHDKFIQPKGIPLKQVPKKKVPVTNMYKLSNLSKTTDEPPPLPTLDFSDLTS